MTEGRTATTQVAALEHALGALRSNNDVLLHKVARTEVVWQQLDVNRLAIGVVREALREAGVDAK